jgi:hypothetical protein
MPYKDPSAQREFNRKLFRSRYTTDPEFRASEALRKARWYRRNRMRLARQRELSVGGVAAGATKAKEVKMTTDEKWQTILQKVAQGEAARIQQEVAEEIEHRFESKMHRFIAAHGRFSLEPDSDYNAAAQRFRRELELDYERICEMRLKEWFERDSDI